MKSRDPDELIEEYKTNFERFGMAYLVLSTLTLHLGVLGWYIYLKQTCTSWCFGVDVFELYIELGLIVLVTGSFILVLVDGLLRWYYTRTEGDSR